MGTQRAENINPAILTWARETAGLSLDEAAERIGLSTSQQTSASEKLEALERGDKKPTRTQLIRMASIYRRPLTAFYMSDRPRPGDRGEDFRTLAGPVSKQEAALLDALLRDIRARQDMVRSILEDEDDVRRLDFVGSLAVDNRITDVAEHIRGALGIKDPEAFRRYNSPNALFEDLRARTETLGVFVLLIGNLGSHHTNISERVFRGFAIADEIAPFIVINDQDARTARSFTLIHELVHIFVGSSGVSAAPATGQAETPIARVERFCNDVAGEVLLPTAGLPEVGPIVNTEDAADIIGEVAENQNVSAPMVAYRFWRTGRISEEIYRELYALYSARWQAQRQRNRELAREEEDGGPSYYVVRRHRLGRALISLVGRTLRANELTHTKAAKMLGVSPSSVEPLLKDVKSVGGSYAPERR